MGIDFTTETEAKRCKQIDRCQELMSDVTDALGFGIDTRKATNRLIKLRNYLNREFPDKRAKARLDALLKERKEMFEALIRINNWCCQDLMENAYVSERSGNYYKTLTGLADICRPFAQLYNSLHEYEGKYEWWLTRETPEKKKPIQTKPSDKERP